MSVPAPEEVAIAPHDATHQAMSSPPEWPWLALLLVLGALYTVGWLRQPAGKRWDPWRAASWFAGLAVAGTALVGPLAETARESFSAHMLGHVLLGMLAPLLLVLGAPVTLLLRALPVARARRAVTILGSPPLRLLAHPITAAILAMGGLALLYRTDLYHLMHDHAALHYLVHLHVLAAGYLFTAAMIGTDPIAHRPSYRYRLAVLVAALAAHAVIAKSLYAAPPAGVPVEEAESGSQLMYYGGDLVDLALVAIFCWQWYRATAPRARPLHHPITDAPEGART